MNRKTRVQEMFARGAKHWSRLYEQAESLFDDNMIRRRDYVCDYVQRYVDVSSRVLDLGCGAGIITERLVQHGMEVAAIDLSHEMISLAKARLHGTLPGRHHFLQGDCERLPFANGEFDAIVCLGVISFLKGDEHVLAEIRRVLRDGGTLVLSVRNRYAFPRFFDPVQAARRWVSKTIKIVRGWSRGERGARADDVPLPRMFSIRRLIAALEEHGFELQARKHIGYGPFTINRKQLFSVPASIRLSNALDRAFHAPVLRALQRFADVCVLVAVKRIPANVRESAKVSKGKEQMNR